MQFKRREVLLAFSAAGVMAASSPSVLAQNSLRSTQLKDGLWLITGAGANVIVAEGSNEVVVVDGGLQEHAQALLAEINNLAGNKPISVLFNTNWRPEHTGLNHLLGNTNTRIIAHENTRLWQSTDVYIEWEDKTYQPMPKSAQANDTFYKNGRLSLGNQTIDYGYMSQAHTDGDIYVHFVEADVLVVGDMLGDHVYPMMDYRTGGWIGGMRNASKALAEIAGNGTQIISAEGSVQSKTDLLAQHEMLAIAYEVVGDAFRSGWSLEELIASRPGEKIGANWGNADLFLTQAYRGTWYHVPGRAVTNVV